MEKKVGCRKQNKWADVNLLLETGMGEYTKLGMNDSPLSKPKAVVLNLYDQMYASRTRTLNSALYA